MADAVQALWSQTRERDATRLNGGTVIAAVWSNAELAMYYSFGNPSGHFSFNSSAVSVVKSNG